MAFHIKGKTIYSSQEMQNHDIATFLAPYVLFLIPIIIAAAIGKWLFGEPIYSAIAASILLLFNQQYRFLILQLIVIALFVGVVGGAIWLFFWMVNYLLN